MAELTFQNILTLFAETDRKRAESDARIEKMNQELKMQFAETDRRMERSSRELDKKIASLGDTLGRFAEEQVRAAVIDKFTNWGIDVHYYTNHFVMKDDNREFVYEIDILIFNENYVIALEVKNTLKKEDVDEHLERMEKIKFLPMPVAKGKTMLAGVAGMIIGEGVDRYAEKKGLFVLKPSGDTVDIVNNKESFKPREWAH